jgi:adenosylhomocysteinase
MSAVKDPRLAPQGAKRIEWAERQMPVLALIRKRFEKEKPFAGKTIGACLHVTSETAVLMRALRAGGAKAALCASNPLSTQDDVAAALAGEGVEVFAVRGESNKDYHDHLLRVLDAKPDVLLDDGADLITAAHKSRPELLKKIAGGCEETTTGVIRFQNMARDGALRFPVIAINNANTKHYFDNYYGTGQSTIDGILRATNMLLAGKQFVVCGYGFCGKGVALRAKGMGADVIVTEVSPFEALRAVMDGFRVMPMADAAKMGDVFVTVTGDTSIIRGEHFAAMKDGAVLANAGHFNVEISIPDLEKLAKSRRNARPNVTEYEMKNGKRIYLLGEGRLVNLACAEGHPAQVMQMSFANQALCAEHLLKTRGLKPGVLDVPRDIDDAVARLALDSFNVKIDALTSEQKKYLRSWEEGT